MRPWTVVLIVAAMILTLTCAAGAQPAPDCAAAKTSVEKAICGNPPVGAADTAMAQAYATLKAALPAEQQAALTADQRQWLKRREGWCGQLAGADLDRCILRDTEQRRVFLAGGAEYAAADAPRVMPGFFNEERKGRYTIAIVYPQIVAQSPAAAAFNRAAHDIAFGKDAVGEYRNMEPPRVPGAENYYEVQYRVPYLGPRLASVIFTTSTFAGGAHPNSNRTSLVYDLAQGHELRLTDFLADTDRAIPAIAALCRGQLEAQAAKQDWRLFDDADFAAVVKDPSNWSVGGDGVEILFDPYSVAAYYVGARECHIGNADLAAWLKPGGPLPPTER